jgi:hypothetical protein
MREIAVRQALPQCLWGSFEFVVKMAFLDWEAAVLPLNYARLVFFEIRHFLHFLARFRLVHVANRCTVPSPRVIAYSPLPRRATSRAALQRAMSMPF